MATILEQKTCVPCRGGIPPLSSNAVDDLLAETEGWETTADHTTIRRDFKLKNFRQSLDFVDSVGELAEAEFHHPLFIKFGWGFAAIALQTKKIKGLHENDFIIAAKINQIFRSMDSEAPG